MTSPPETVPEDDPNNSPAEWSQQPRHVSDLIIGSIRIGLPLLLWGSLSAWLVWRVPIVRQTFEEFGVDVTLANQSLFQISRVATRFWPLLLILLGGFGLLTWSLEQWATRNRREIVAWIWFLLTALVPLIIWGVAEFSLITQLHQLLNDLTPR